MAVPHIFAPGREQCFQQIERLINSHSLHGSEALCKLLRYLAMHSLAHPQTTVKEYQIATEVFGRSAGFDPQADSTVRVQAGRLRIKLARYYASEGADDPIVVELPKGSYALTFHARAPEIRMARPDLSPVPRELKRDHSPQRQVAILVLSGISVSLLLATLILVARVKSQPAAKPEIPAAYLTFWSRFVNSIQQPLVIFSNGSFVGRPETGMRYFNSARDSGSFILDHYTGVGEVLGVHQLDNLFRLLNRQIWVKRGALFSLDDAKNTDLIFVGSPSENLTLLDIPGTRDFIFQRLDSGPRKGDLAVRNVHPEPGEPAVFLPTPADQPTTEDYAVVSLLPGLDPSRSVLILAGNTTFGTQAAVEYVCREDSLRVLLQRLHVSKASELKPFEALLHVRIAHGVPVTTQLMAVRQRGN